MNDGEILWKPDQNMVYVADFEKMFEDAVVMIWPQVIRDEYGVHFVYKLNRGHMHEGEMLSSTETNLVFRWDHDQRDSELIRVHPMTDQEFSDFQKQWPVYECKDGILKDYARAN